MVYGRDVKLEYSYDPDIAPIPHDVLEGYANELGSGIGNSAELIGPSRTLTCFESCCATTPLAAANLFKIAEFESVEQNLASVMMPFAPMFDSVYHTLQRAAVSVKMALQRADNIWEHSVIVQDIVSLIDRSRIVICDRTDQNSNVFYEIAHTLGREVILITQNGDDVPFDLHHHRYVRYSPTPDGLAPLQTEIQALLITIKGR